MVENCTVVHVGIVGFRLEHHNCKYYPVPWCNFVCRRVPLSRPRMKEVRFFRGIFGQNGVVPAEDPIVERTGISAYIWAQLPALIKSSNQWPVLLGRDGIRLKVVSLD